MHFTIDFLKKKSFKLKTLLQKCKKDTILMIYFLQLKRNVGNSSNVFFIKPKDANVNANILIEVDVLESMKK